MNIPIISIIIPVYNTERYLAKCLDSCVNQIFNNIEIIVVNDGSQGNCKEICDKYPNIIYTEYKTNKGLFHAREYGVRQAKGEYIFHVDADDWISSLACEAIAKQIQKENSDLIMHSSLRILPKNKIKQNSYSIKNNFFDLLMNNKSHAHHFLWQFTFKREISLEVYNILKVKERLILSEDVLFFNCYLYYAQSWSKIKEICYYYNECNMDSATRRILTTKKALQNIEFMGAVFEYLEKFRQNNNLPSNIFENIKNKQYMDRICEMKSVYLDLDWEIIFPQLIKVFHGNRLARNLYDLAWTPTMKLPIRKINIMIQKILEIILPEGSIQFNILQSIWWKLK